MHCLQDSYAAGAMHCCSPSEIRKPVLLSRSIACLRHNTPAVSCTVPCQAFTVLSVPNSSKYAVAVLSCLAAEAVFCHSARALAAAAVCSEHLHTADPVA